MLNLNINDFVSQAKASENGYSFKPQFSVVNSPGCAVNIAPPVASTVNTAVITSFKQEIPDEFVKLKKERSLSEKAVDFARNITGIGFGSKKTAKIIEDYKQGKIDENSASEALTNYKAANNSSLQVFGDIASVASGLSVFYGIKKGAKYLDALFQLNAEPEFIKNMANSIKHVKNIDILSPLKNIISSNKKTTLLAIPFAMIVSGFVKKDILKLDRIGTKKFKPKKEEMEGLDRKEKKKYKKDLKKAKRKENWKNFYTGALNGAIAPLSSLLGIVGVPVWAASSFGLRHVTSNKEQGIGEDLKNNAGINILGTVAAGALMIKKHNYHKVFAQNADKVVNKLKDVVLQNPDFKTGKTTYEELQNILLGSPEIENIMCSSSNVDDVIQNLTRENIFAVKFKQIMHSSDELTERLREKCPPSRTLEQAQEAINNLSKGDSYQVEKLLGVGTIAETYFAKDKNGKEVCIKILKDGISKEKILQDKEKFKQLVTNGLPVDKLDENQEYLLKNIDNLADGILNEVDFKNEMCAAQKLKEFTKQANVVVPIKADDGIYVMEKANGISLASLQKYYECRQNMNRYTEWLKTETDDYSRKLYLKRIKEAKKGLEELKERTPDFEDFELSDNELKKMLHGYIDVYAEQFDKVLPDGKTLHADIHPGNIFIDVDALKAGEGKIFTLIDTGNTVHLNAEQSRRAMKLTRLILNGDTKELAKYVTEGAILPQGMTYEKALEIIEKEMNALFFDSKTKLNKVTNDSILALASGIMRKHDIIPNDTQLNLNKAKTSARNSLDALAESFFSQKYTRLNDDAGTSDALIMAHAAKDIASVAKKSVSTTKTQEIKNLFRMPIKDAIASLRKKPANKTNSENYLTYKFKQMIRPSDNDFADKF